MLSGPMREERAVPFLHRALERPVAEPAGGEAVLGECRCQLHGRERRSAAPPDGVVGQIPRGRASHLLAASTRARWPLGHGLLLRAASHRRLRRRPPLPKLHLRV